MINEIVTFLGWCSIINFCILSISSLLLLSFKGFVTGFHSKISGVDKKELLCLYFQYLANYKVIIIVFNFVPYIALKIMA